MSDLENHDNWIVTKDGMPITEMMGCAAAHNHALKIKSDDEELLEVVERFNFFCVKCGDDYWTSAYEEYMKIRGNRWRCNTCVWGWL
jgi:hypothetical protein